MLLRRNLQARKKIRKCFLLATIGSGCFATAVLALVAKLDGSNVLMFHVEQWDKRWSFRLRSVGDHEWGDEIEAPFSSQEWPLPDVTRAVECQWRSEGLDWQDAVPMEFGEAVCEFVVWRDVPFEVGDDPVRFCGIVDGRPSVWELDLPKEILFKDSAAVRCMGRSVQRGLGQVLGCEGVFSLKVGGWKVSNSAASQAALLPVEVAIPGSMPPEDIYMVVSGRLSQEELKHLMQEV